MKTSGKIASAALGGGQPRGAPVGRVPFNAGQPSFAVVTADAVYEAVEGDSSKAVARGGHRRAGQPLPVVHAAALNAAEVTLRVVCAAHHVNEIPAGNSAVPGARHVHVADLNGRHLAVGQQSLARGNLGAIQLMQA